MPPQLPEELLERILALALSPPSRPVPLLVCKAWLRIATPLLYHSPVPTSALLCRTLSATPALTAHVRHLAVRTDSPHFTSLLALCPHTRHLDITLAPADHLPPAELPALPAVRHLVLRKAGPTTYLSIPSVRAAIAAVASAVPTWPDLESAHILLRLSDDSTSGTSGPLPPTTRLTRALALAPRLTTLTTQLPAIWNPCILTISRNPALTAIRLIEHVPDHPATLHRTRSASMHAPHPPAPHAILATNLFLMEARKHPRLMDLVRTGTCIVGGAVRGRAQTLGVGQGGALGGGVKV